MNKPDNMINQNTIEMQIATIEEGIKEYNKDFIRSHTGIIEIEFAMITSIFDTLRMVKQHFGNQNGDNYFVSMSPDKYKKFNEFLNYLKYSDKNVDE